MIRPVFPDLCNHQKTLEHFCPSEKKPVPLRCHSPPTPPAAPDVLPAPVNSPALGVCCHGLRPLVTFSDRLLPRCHDFRARAGWGRCLGCHCSLVSGSVCVVSSLIRRIDI